MFPRSILEWHGVKRGKIGSRRQSAGKRDGTTGGTTGDPSSAHCLSTVLFSIFIDFVWKIRFGSKNTKI